MIARLEANARDRSLAGVEAIAVPIENLSLPAGRFDLVRCITCGTATSTGWSRPPTAGSGQAGR